MYQDQQTTDIDVAKALALKFHAGQLYGKRPYFEHLVEVARGVTEGATDERLEQVAYLHDILEDTECLEETLRHLFEDNVVDAVVAMTRMPKEDRYDYLKRVKANPLARMVKIHDSMANLRASVMRYDPKRIRKYAENISFLANESA